MHVRRWVLLFVTAATAFGSSGELGLPSEHVERLPSPNGSRILYGVPYELGRNEGPELWIEDAATHKRTKLLDVPGTLSAGWSADSKEFYVNDHWASDREQAYVYNAATLTRIDLAERILKEDPEIRPYAFDHPYFEVTGWDGPQGVFVRFFGHTTGPVVCFSFRYRVSLTGAVQKLSQHVAPVTANFCEGFR